MALWITEDCIACGACEPECPEGAIMSGGDEIYHIDQDICNECEGLDGKRCLEVCPVDCIIESD